MTRPTDARPLAVVSVNGLFITVGDVIVADVRGGMRTEAEALVKAYNARPPINESTGIPTCPMCGTEWDQSGGQP
jgi:hypothetical protein